ncbi:MAG TPA: hypothetical protein VM142_13160, partial [Acidimicrobiales bacterium]|nr:hypothetical protein [Acidimicrobiales bacterium]
DLTVTPATNCEAKIAAKVRTNTTTPATYLSDVVAIAAGNSHSLALKSDGTVWAWGDNGQSQLGRATTCDPSTTPPTNCTSTFAVQVLTSPLTALSGVAAISAGGLHSLALKSDGTAWSWGRNIEGQLGNATAGIVTAAANSNTARPVAELAGITKIAGGGLHSLAYVP